MASSMHAFFGVSVLLLCTMVAAQQPGTQKKEANPTMTFKECTKDGGCTSRENKVVLDANWRWVHTKSGNCYTGNKFDDAKCPDSETCAKECALEGVDAKDYKNTYGITAVEGGVKLGFVTGENVGSRLFMLDDDGENYKMFKLKNREFSMDIDSSALPCGLNGAMYFVEMAKTGGKGLNNNDAGAPYGTGYCDAQCPHDMKFINGKANSGQWKPNTKDKSGNMGIGKMGSCCAEMDIWEANKMSTSYTAHPCNLTKAGAYECEGTECGDNDSEERYKGICDKDGCDLNPFRNGDEKFYGDGSEFKLDSSKMMTVVTQFLTTDGTDEGDMSEIRRYYVQDGKKIESPPISITPSKHDSITDEFCDEQKVLFGDTAPPKTNDFKNKGGNAQMGESLDRGHVAVFSLWDDVDVNMMWLDSAYPTDRPSTDPGIKRGNCPGGAASAPMAVRQKFGSSAYVIFANVAVGEIGSTQGPTTSVATPPATSGSTSPSRTGGTQVPPKDPSTAGGACEDTNPQCAADWFTTSQCTQDYWANQCKKTCNSCGVLSLGSSEGGSPSEGYSYAYDYGYVSLGSSEGGSPSEGYSYAYGYDYNSDYYEDGSALIQSEVTAHGDIITSTRGGDSLFLRPE